MSTHLKFHSEVASALLDGRPVVALESTLITHGFAPPDNLSVARRIEAAVREGGATPATIAILHGQITVGLDEAQLEALAEAAEVRKVSRRDLGVAAARSEMGATTVAGTMVVAHLAGLRVLATGGIGGVHRGHPFDVSADLLELAKSGIVSPGGLSNDEDLYIAQRALELTRAAVTDGGEVLFLAACLVVVTCQIAADPWRTASGLALVVVGWPVYLLWRRRGAPRRLRTHASP